MKVRAPGKLVLSGAYAVLEGAPAIVTAVDRHAVADSSRPAEFVTDEMRAAGSGPYAYFDASELRADDRKLGLGSSAAILVATLGTQPETDLTSQSGRDALFERALNAHRSAQGGGSGVDVAASVYGGHLRYQLHAPLRAPVGDGSRPRWPGANIAPTQLPSRVELSVFGSPHAASTSEFLTRVYAWRESATHDFDAWLLGANEAADQACEACARDDVSTFIAALTRQSEALSELGSAAAVPIVTDAVSQLDAAARKVGGCVLPAGAGGGDVSLFVRELGVDVSEVSSVAGNLGLTLLRLNLGAPGVTQIAPQA